LQWQSKLKSDNNWKFIYWNCTRRIKIAMNSSIKKNEKKLKKNCYPHGDVDFARQRILQQPMILKWEGFHCLKIWNIFFDFFFTFSFLSILFSLFLSFHAIVWYSQNKTTIIQWQLRMIFDGFLVQFVGSFWHFLCKIWKTKIKLTF
jgi:hypothetical protein